MKQLLFTMSLLLFSFSGIAKGNKTNIYDFNHIQDFEVFTDGSCSKLKKGTKPKHIKGLKNPLLKDIAQQLYEGDYASDYIVGEYNAVTLPEVTGEKLKTGHGFSRYENMTGVFIPKGQTIVFVGNTGGNAISLLLPNLMRKPADGCEPTKDPEGWGLKCKTIELNEGVNIVEADYDCNAYISYFAEDPSVKPAITVHFPQGLANGYFDIEKHNDEDWNRLLDNAVSPIMDAKGKYIQVAYPVEYFKEYTYSRGVELIENYDKMLLSHYRFMGLEKYGKLPPNRIFARVNFNYYMFRDGDGVAYLGDSRTMRMVAEPSVVINGDPCWGFSHEVGHVLQMRPQTTWGGMTEVSNNLFSLYTTTGFGNVSRLKADNHYAAAREQLLGSGKSYLLDSDVFNRLVPFWQLHLYFSRNGKPEFYADMMEYFRNTPDAGNDNESINNQFEFIKAACDIGQTDLTGFFEQWGFFYVGEMEIDDYNHYSFEITQKQADDTKAYIASKNYPKPTVDITTLED